MSKNLLSFSPNCVWSRGSRLAVSAVLALIALAIVGCESGGGDKKAAAPAAPAAPAPAPAQEAAPAAAAAPVTGGRALSADQAAALERELGTEIGSDKKAWLQATGNDPEAEAYRDQIAKSFKAAGWDVNVLPNVQLRIKPGVFFFIAEEESYPTYVNTALSALKAGEIDVKDAAGYRAYYEEQKKQNPSWQGVELAKDQSFVIVVGRKP